MFNLENMDDAVLERQKIANLFAGFYEQNVDPESPDSMIDEMTDDGAELDDDDVPLAGLEPATMQELPPGYKATFSNPPSPGTDYSEFVRGHLLACASRQGVPYEVLTGDLRNVSDRALRLILNEFRRGLEMKQWLYFIPRWCQRIRTACLDMAHLSGALELERYQERRAELIETLWVPQGWPYSHPVQDVTADLKAVRGGLTSRSERILSTGADPEKVDQDIAADNVRADKLGLVLDSDPRKVSNAGLTQARAPGSKIPPTEDEDEEGGEDEDTADEPSDDDEQDQDSEETDR
jgi:lambda family phage portal protein